LAVEKKGDSPKKGSPKKRLQQLDKKEKVESDEDDALRMATLRAWEWARRKRKQIGYAFGAIALGGALFTGWMLYKTNREEKASNMVYAGVAAELAPIREGMEDPETLKRITFYGSEDEKQKAALAAYASAKASYGDTGVGILARLGEAGVFLDRREWDQALAAYADVRKTALAAADSNVRMRCMEGLGYANEGKGLLDDSRRAFDELSNIDAKGAKPLGLYHLARLDVAKGDKDAAINKLKNARESIMSPGAPSARYLKEQIDKLLGKLDPTLVPKAPPGMQGIPGMPGGGGGPGGKMTKEQMEQLLKQLQSQGAGGGGGGAPPAPLPKGP